MMFICFNQVIIREINIFFVCIGSRGGRVNKCLKIYVSLKKLKKVGIKFGVRGVLCVLLQSQSRSGKFFAVFRKKVCWKFAGYRKSP